VRHCHGNTTPDHQTRINAAAITANTVQAAHSCAFMFMIWVLSLLAVGTMFAATFQPRPTASWPQLFCRDPRAGRALCGPTPFPPAMRGFGLAWVWRAACSLAPIWHNSARPSIPLF
jgi:hypothetical protein